MAEVVIKVALRQTIMAVIGGIMAFAAFTLGDRFIPVVAFVDVKKIERSGDGVEVHFHGRKIRHCALVDQTVVGWQLRGDGVWAETAIPVRVLRDASPGSSRPASAFEEQDFGTWELRAVDPDAVAVRATVAHLCDGDKLPRTTVLGPWELGG